MVRKIQNAGISGAHVVAPAMSRAQAEKEIGKLMAEQRVKNIVILKDSHRLPVRAKYACFLKCDDVYQLIAEQEIAEGDVMVQLFHAPSRYLAEGRIPLTVNGLLRHREIQTMATQLGAGSSIQDRRGNNYAEPCTNLIGLYQFFSNRHSHDLSDNQTVREFLDWLDYTPRQAYYTLEERSSLFEHYVEDTSVEFGAMYLRKIAELFVEQEQHIAGSVDEAEYAHFKPMINGWVSWHTGEIN